MHIPAARFFAIVIQPLYAEPVLNFAMITVGQINELERSKVILPNQRRAQPCAQPEEKHAAANMTAECLHGGVVNDAGWPFQRPAKIEPDPTFAEMFGIFHNLTFADY